MSRLFNMFSYTVRKKNTKKSNSKTKIEFPNTVCIRGVIWPQKNIMFLHLASVGRLQRKFIAEVVNFIFEHQYISMHIFN